MEMWIRFWPFFAVFSIMVTWECLSPRRILSQRRAERWPTNLGLTLLNMVLVWAVVGGVAYMAATFAAEQQIGLLHWVSAPFWFAVPASILVLDFALYVQHRLFHSFPLLWRVHQVHHADLGVDATTGLRFHPIEIFLSLAYKAVVIIALGAPAWAAVAFEILLNATSVFNHSNVSLPERLDQGLRWFLVTPDMHRIHHSTRAEETHANFGFSVPWWDRLCRTYRAEPALGQLGLEIGLSWYRASFSLGQVLLLPFQTSPPLEKTWKEVSPLQLREMLAEENPPYVLDVRDRGEFTGELGHIAGAHLLPVSDLDKRLNELALGRSRPVVLV